MADSKSS